MAHTPQQVKETIAKLPDFTSDQLIHYYKVITSKKSAKEKKLYSPLLKAIEKERKSRGTKTISSSIVKPSIKTTKPKSGANPDDY